MSLASSCPKCGTNYPNIPKKHAGKSIQCRQCGEVFLVGGAASPPVPSIRPTLTAEQASASKKQPKPPLADWAIGDRILSLYEVEAVLGEGQFGTVYRVRHPSWGLDLAVKSPKPAALVNGAENVEREAETWVNLGLHPNIVSCYYVRRIDQIPRIFTEYVSGGDLKEWIRGGKLYQGTPQQGLLRVLDIAIQFARGLHYAHEQGLIHQDIKPANVMLSAQGIAKITDFGLARVGVPSASATGTPLQGDTLEVKGIGMTPAYASPEQAAQGTLTRRADLWSWAVSVLEMFIGSCTWAAGSIAPVLLEELQAGRMASVRIPTLPETVFKLLAHCFQEDPNQRPANLQIVAASLQQSYQQLAGKPYPRPNFDASRENPASLNNRAVSLLDLGRGREAQTMWQKALAVDPQHLETTYNSAVYEWRQKGLAETVLFRRMHVLQQAHEENARYYHWLGKLYLHFGQYTQAANILKSSATNKASSDLDLPKDIALALAAKARKITQPESWKEIAGYLSKALKINPDACTISAYTLTLQRQGQNKPAAAFYQRAKARLQGMPASPRRAFAHYLPGYEEVIQLSPIANMQVAFADQGRYAVSGGQDGLLRLWDPLTGKCLFTAKRNQGPITALCARSTGQILTGSDTGDIQQWELSQGQAKSSFTAHKAAIHGLACSADGLLLLTAAADRGLRLWQMDSQARCPAFQGQGHRKAIHSLAITPEADYAVTAGQENVLRLWDMSMGKSMAQLQGHEDEITCVATLPKYRALSASKDRRLRIWDLKKRVCVQVLAGHTAPVNALAVAADASYVLSGDREGVLRYWHLNTGTSMMAGRVAGAVYALALHPRFPLALVAHAEGLCLLIPQNPSRYPLPMMISLPISASQADARAQRYAALLTQAQASLQKKEYATLYSCLSAARKIEGFERDAKARDLWPQLYPIYPKGGLRAAWKLRQFTEHGGAINDIAICPVTGHLFSASSDYSVRRFEPQTGNCLQVYSGHSNAVHTICITRDGQEMLSASQDGSIRVWDTTNANVLLHLTEHAEPIKAALFTADGRFVLAAEEEGAFSLWQRQEAKRVGEFRGGKGRINTLALSPDSQMAATGDVSGRIHLWDMTTGKRAEIMMADHAARISAMAFTPDGRHLLSGSWDYTLRIWSLQSKECVRVLEIDQGRILAIAISSDGQYVLSGSEEGVLSLWQWNIGQCLQVFNTTEPITAVGFSRHGKEVYAGNQQGELFVFHLDWELEAKHYQPWDEGALPYLEQFLTLHKHTEASPSWSNEALQALLETLGQRGYGWLQAQGINNKLKALATTWPTTTSVGKKFPNRMAIPLLGEGKVGSLFKKWRKSK